MIDKNGNLINHWYINSNYTPWWKSEICIDPNDESKLWVNVGYVNPMITNINKLENTLAISAWWYSKMLN
jgi:hypothetical protein